MMLRAGMGLAVVVAGGCASATGAPSPDPSTVHEVTIDRAEVWCPRRLDVVVLLDTRVPLVSAVRARVDRAIDVWRSGDYELDGWPEFVPPVVHATVREAALDGPILPLAGLEPNHSTAGTGTLLAVVTHAALTRDQTAELDSLAYLVSGAHFTVVSLDDEASEQSLWVAGRNTAGASILGCFPEQLLARTASGRDCTLWEEVAGGDVAECAALSGREVPDPGQSRCRVRHAVLSTDGAQTESGWMFDATSVGAALECRTGGALFRFTPGAEPPDPSRIVPWLSCLERITRLRP